MDRIKDYDILGVNVEIVYFSTKHGEKTFPRVKDVFHCETRITDLLDHNILEKVESELYKKLNNITT